MFSLGLLILWSAANESEIAPALTDDDRSDIERWSKARGYSLEPIASDETQAPLQNV